MEDKMAKPKEEKRVSVFLIEGEYEPVVTQGSEHLRIMMSESDFRALSKPKQKLGIRYIPERWLKHENMQHDLPLLFLRGNILGIIVPSLESEDIRRVREKVVLLGSLPMSCFKHSRYPEFIEASRNFDKAWENLRVAYADLMNQLELAEKKED